MKKSISLEKINDDNIKFYKEYEIRYETHLKEFQSRIYPKQDAFQICWYHIKYDGNYIGSVWLEKINEDDDSAVLGIFIAFDEFRSMGIGSKAISEIIKTDMNFLNVRKIILHVRKENMRAISCYEKSGFEVTDEYQKNNIPAYEMTFQKKRILPDISKNLLTNTLILW